VAMAGGYRTAALVAKLISSAALESANNERKLLSAEESFGWHLVVMCPCARGCCHAFR